MTRPDLGDSDLQGLDATYRKRCDPRWWAAQEEAADRAYRKWARPEFGDDPRWRAAQEVNRAMRQNLQLSIKKAKRIREPARKAWTRPALWIAVLLAGPFASALLFWLVWGGSWD